MILNRSIDDQNGENKEDLLDPSVVKITDDDLKDIREMIRDGAIVREIKKYEADGKKEKIKKVLAALSSPEFDEERQIDLFREEARGALVRLSIDEGLRKETKAEFLRKIKK